LSARAGQYLDRACDEGRAFPDGFVEVVGADDEQGLAAC
jgi:hypothetical protein